MARVVMDINVIISALLFDGIPEQAVLHVLTGYNTSVLSPFIIEETGRILQTKFNASNVNIRLLQQLLTASDMQYFQPFLHIIMDEPDNRILETAICGNADFIVTGDKLLLDLKTYKDIDIIKPADFLKQSSGA